MTDDFAAVIDRIAQARRGEILAGSAGALLGCRVSEAVDGIRRVYHRDWEARRLGEARALAASIADGVPVPALSVCGHGTAETRYTQYLAHFLNPSRLHGLGALYLDCLLSTMRRRNPSIPEDIDTMSATVAAEVCIGNAPGKDGCKVGCTCDVVVECLGHVVFIEHKVSSGQSPNPNSDDPQLKRYDIAIDGNPAYRELVKIRVYLTPGGSDSYGLTGWLGMSHSDLATAGLELLRRGQLSVSARENLKRFIIDVLLGPYEQAEDEIWELEARARSASQSSDFGERLRFDRMVDRNRLLVDLLLEG